MRWWFSILPLRRYYRLREEGFQFVFILVFITTILDISIFLLIVVSNRSLRFYVCRLWLILFAREPHPNPPQGDGVEETPLCYFDSAQYDVGVLLVDSLDKFGDFRMFYWILRFALNDGSRCISATLYMTGWRLGDSLDIIGDFRMFYWILRFALNDGEVFQV